MGRLARAAVSGAVACLVASGCSKAAPPPPVCSAPQGSSGDAVGLASNDTAFAVDLFQPALAATGPSQNVILSPYSVSATLTMVDVGAAGETDSQIQSVLHLPGNGATIAPAYAALACADETDGAAGGDTLAIANSVWGQQGMAFQQGFLSTLSGGYDAPLQQVDFASDPGGAATSINAWIADKTHGQIPSLVQPGDIGPGARLVLADAVYFKGSWETAFDPSQTSPRAFTLADGSQVEVPTMSGQVTLRSGYVQNALCYELGYKGGALAMDFVVPMGTLAAFEAALVADSLATTIASLGPPEPQTQMLLPKFSFTTRLALAPILGAMGMPDHFDPTKADLSGMDGAKDLYVSAVVQEALVEVDESGTVAAAATEGTVGNAFVAEPIAIDHPFLFLVRDTRNGSILFMGQVVDPRQGS